MAKIRAVKTEAQVEHFPYETIGHYELRTGKDRMTGKELSSHEKMRGAHRLLDPKNFGLSDVVNFADGLALIFSCADGNENEEWGQFATMAAAPLRTVVSKAKHLIGEMETAHSVLGDILKSLEE